MNDTKQKLSKALQQLIQTKPLDKIRISDITDYCNMNRQTFYYHFHDIYDLIEYSYYHLPAGSLAIENIKNHPEYTWEEMFYELLSFIRENQLFISRVYHSLFSRYLDLFLEQSISDFVKGKLDKINETIQVEEIYVEHIAAFYIHALVGRITDWIDKGMNYSIDDAVYELSRIMEGALVNTLQTFSSEK